MNYIQCKRILEQYVASYKWNDKWLTLFKKALGDNRLQCYKVMKEKMWTKQFLDYIKNLSSLWFHWAPTSSNSNKYYEVENSELVWNKSEQTHTNTYQEQIQHDQFSPSEFFSPVVYWFKMVWITIGLLILAYLVFRFIKYFLAFIYDVFNANRYIWLKVTLPRWDTKVDREKEKEIAKDMKEKIARMSQVYRNLHKLWELSVRDSILNFLFDKPKLTFALHYENWLLYFLIWTYPEYRKIVESAIAAQYPDASIETITSPKFFKKKYYDIIPLQPVKNSMYPIRIFKQLEDDPLNNIIDAIWKVSPEDTFTTQLIIKPAPDSFNKKLKFLQIDFIKKTKL